MLSESLATNHKQVGRLHVITTETLQSQYTHEEIARLCLTGGADVIQFREKRNQTTRAQLRTLTKMQEAIASSSCHLIVNDRSDLAKAASAGLHIGPDDIAPEIAREILGSNAIIGATANNLAMLRQLQDAPIDYVGVGPVFGTTSKENPATELGLEGLEQMVNESPFPVIAIGSIQAGHIPSILETGAHGVAVISGIVLQKDPGTACRTYRDAIDQFLLNETRP